MRKHTDPGVAPPAPGSVGPHMFPAQPAPPAAAVDAGRDPDEIPTKPDNSVAPELLKLVRLVDCMPVVERRRFIALADNYGKCALGRRVLLEEIAREFAQQERKI